MKNNDYHKHFLITVILLLFSPLVGSALGDFFSRFFYRNSMMDYIMILCCILVSIIYYIEFHNHNKE